MRTTHQPDLSGLALLAQSADPALRPLLLQVQAASFAGAPQRGRDALLRFEALALGLIPFSTSDVLTDVAGTLRRLSDPPLRVLDAIERRLREIIGQDEDAESFHAGRAMLQGLTASEILSLVGEGDDDVDLALARNLGITLDGVALESLIDRARGRRVLALALHARPEPTIYDRAALYRFGSREDRYRIRASLRQGGVRPHAPSRIPDLGTLETMAALAADGASLSFTRLVADLAQAGLPDPLVFSDEGSAELLALTLVSLGLPPSEAVRMLLTLDAALTQSVGGFFALADVLRGTPRSVATEIIRCNAKEAPAARVPERAATPPQTSRRAVGQPGQAQRSESRLVYLTPGPRALPRRPGAIDPDDRRWKATTNPDRT